MSDASFLPFPLSLPVARARNKGVVQVHVLRAWLALSGLFDGYHPERHYMRGPGPKCREKTQGRKS